MAHKKAGGSSRNGRDSPGQKLGVKEYGSQLVGTGYVIVRQHGTHFLPGQNVGRARDNSLFALKAGVVKFERISREKKKISVVPVS